MELKSGGKAGAEYQLVNVGMEPLPPEAIVDGAIMDSGAVIEAIQRVFSAQKIKTSDVATAVSGNAVIVKPHPTGILSNSIPGPATAAVANRLIAAAMRLAEPMRDMVFTLLVARPWDRAGRG